MSDAIRSQHSADPIRVAMIGGGPGAFIGAVHRAAMRMTGRYRLVAGSFSQSAERSCDMGRELGLDQTRVYSGWEEAIAREATLPEGERCQLIAIVTPNHLHLPVAQAALERGFAVMCEKPMSRTWEEAAALAALARRSRAPFALAHTYLGYPMVREMRRRIAAGELGEIRRVNVIYTQGWLSQEIEAQANKQAAWRTDPALSGPAGALGDIGTHASSLVEFVTGHRIAEVSADITSFGASRAVDDDVSVLFRTAEGAKGTLVASQICTGEENGLSIAAYGTEAGMHWRQEEPNTVWLHPDRAPAQRIRGGADNAYLSAGARAMFRLPSGHPEGFLEALANLYEDFATTIGDPAQRPGELPGSALGLSTMDFVDAVLRNASGEAKWTALRGDRSNGIGDDLTAGETRL